MIVLRRSTLNGSPKSCMSTSSLQGKSITTTQTPSGHGRKRTLSLRVGFKKKPRQKKEKPQKRAPLEVWDSHVGVRNPFLWRCLATSQKTNVGKLLLSKPPVPYLTGVQEATFQSMEALPKLGTLQIWSAFLSCPKDPEIEWVQNLGNLPPLNAERGACHGPDLHRPHPVQPSLTPNCGAPIVAPQNASSRRSSYRAMKRPDVETVPRVACFAQTLDPKHQQSPCLADRFSAG